MPTATLTTTISYIAPGPTPVQSTFIAQTLYQASAVGFVDVPAATADATAFSIPIGSVAQFKGVLIQNNTNQQMNVRMNGAEADEWSLPPSGVFIPLFAASAALDDPVTEIELVTTALTTEDGTIGYIVLGDE